MTRTRAEDQFLDKISELVAERDYWRDYATDLEKQLAAARG